MDAVMVLPRLRDLGRDSYLKLGVSKLISLGKVGDLQTNVSFVRTKIYEYVFF